MAMEVPSGWYEVIRGPRLPSVRWPQAQHLQPPYGQQSERREKVNFQEGRRGRWRNPVRHPAQDSHAARAGPDEIHAAACARVKQLQNAIDALDEKDPLVASLRAELQKARSKARVVPVEDRIKSTTAFLEAGRSGERIGGKEGSWRLHRRMSGMERPGWSGSGRRLLWTFALPQSSSLP